MATVVVANRLGLCFRVRRQPEAGALRQAWTSLRRLASRDSQRALGSDSLRWALRSVSLSVEEGEALGVLGANGAGKSTLLQVLGGLIEPQEGSVRVTGRIAGLLDLTAGLHPDLTGRENSITGCMIAGLSRASALDVQQEIFDFAELADDHDQSVRTYSSGMRMRLAFSVAVHSQPDVLLIDEHLAVGDLAFRRKCLDRIRQLKAEGCAIVLASNHLEPVRTLCDRALWLENGAVREAGPAKHIAGKYEVASGLMPSKPRSFMSPDPPAKKPPLRRHELRISDVQFKPSDAVATGDSLAVEIGYDVLLSEVSGAIFSVRITDDQRQLFFARNSATESLPELGSSGVVQLHIERLDLVAGRYYVDVGIHHLGWRYAYDHHWHQHTLVVHSSGAARGPLAPPSSWKLERNPATCTGDRESRKEVACTP